MTTRSTPAPERLAAWLDEEMTDEERREFERLMEAHPEWREEAAEMAALSSALNTLKYTSPPPKVWDNYWEQIHGRLKERTTGWIALAVGGTLITAFGSWKVITWATNPFARLGLVLVITGLLITFVSVVRGHLLERPHDRYRKVRR